MEFHSDINEEVTMNSRTYYDVLGVSRDATVEEITTAKNALAKVYHPDANVHKDIDTTAFMQEILEAYRVLSDPEKRKAYNQEIFGEQHGYLRPLRSGRTMRKKNPLLLSCTGTLRISFTRCLEKACA